MSARVVVVGCGLFGVTAALELRRRGHRVTVLETSAAPAPGAASTDISKIIRLEYGTNEVYTDLAERSLRGWQEWDERWRAIGRPGLLHRTGLLLLTRDTMAPGDFEHDSFHLLQSRGHQVERLDGKALVARFPAWSASFSDGFFSPAGGYVESAGVVWALTEEAREAGVAILQQTPAATILTSSGRVRWVEDQAGRRHKADLVVISTGAWTADLLPRLKGDLRRNYQPVWHLRPKRPELFRAEVFPVFTADISRTGYYGFPLHPIHAVVKIGHHGHPIEAEVGPPETLRPPPEETERLRDFLAGAIPPLADAEVAYSTLCPYCDTADEHFWIARDPDCEGLTVAAGGSGHAFKFAPLLGGIIADTAEGEDHPLAELFGWREELRGQVGFEPSRCRDG